jgi:hypothetical protein
MGKVARKVWRNERGCEGTSFTVKERKEGRGDRTEKYKI